MEARKTSERADVVVRVALAADGLFALMQEAQGEDACTKELVI